MLMLTALVLGAQGCASYGDSMEKARIATVERDFVAAKSYTAEALDKSGSDALLYYLELGLLEHLDKNYEQSNVFFAAADKISEDLYTQKAGDILKVLTTNPRSGPYRGLPHERVLINYLKSVNYIMLANASKDQGQSSDLFLEKALIEAKRAHNILSVIEEQEGTYEELDTEKTSLFSLLRNIFAALNNDFIDESSLIYRQDAWVNYMIGLTYETNKEWDNARISYQISAELYEKGYQEQYDLSKEMISQAWYDTVRMIKMGDENGEWREEPQAKNLTNKEIMRLEAETGMAEIVVIESAGLAPEIKELNLVMSIQGRELLLQPVPVGSEQERRDQFSWFFMLYADTGLINMVQNYNEDGVGSAVEGFYSAKHFGLFSIYNIAKEIGLVETLSANPIRVTIPYLAPVGRTKPNVSTVNIDGTSYGFYTSESIANLSLYDLLINADDNIQAAVARESLKAVLVHKAAATGNSQSKLLISFAANIVAAALSQAETRSWSLLPYEIRIKRLAVYPGEHTVNLSGIDQTPRVFQLESGDVRVIKSRQF